MALQCGIRRYTDYHVAIDSSADSIDFNRNRLAVVNAKLCRIIRMHVDMALCHHQADFFQFDEAKPLFHIKFAYAASLYEAGYMRKAQRQFQEILNLNPEDLFQVRHYLMSIALYFEELESCRELLEKYRRNDPFSCFIRFLYHMKEEDFEQAKRMIPLLKEKNSFLYDILTYRSMNAVVTQGLPLEGSLEEAGYIYRIVSKVVQPMEYLHIFLVKNEAAD